MSQCDESIRRSIPDPAQMAVTIHKLVTENESLKRELAATDCLVKNLKRQNAGYREKLQWFNDRVKEMHDRYAGMGE